MGARPSAFVLVTGNLDKLAGARRIVGADLEAVRLDLPEIQSLDLREVLSAKAEEAWRRLHRPLVVEETGLELAALGGFPGPLVRWMLEAVGPEGIAECVLALGNPVATVRCVVLYRDGNTTVVGEGLDHGRLVLPARGEAGFGWDPVFVPDHSQQTWAEVGADEKDERGHRGKAWRSLLEKLEVEGPRSPSE